MNINNLESIVSKSREVTEKDIKLFEIWRGYKLPEDFIEFNLKFPGAYFEGEFDAVGRKNSLISNILLFSKDDEDSIYIDEAYGIKDFGPFIIFGEDPGGNFIAFDYSKDELNPSVVFIDHEELGLIELPEGTTEDDYTAAEIDKMMNSDKLIDFPWAIHYASPSFTDFMNSLRYSVPQKYDRPYEKLDMNEFENFIHDLKPDVPDSFRKFIIHYAGVKFNGRVVNLEKHVVRIDTVINFNKKSINDYYEYISLKGGEEKFKNLIPFLFISYNNELRDSSMIALNMENDKMSIVVIPHDVLHKKDVINEKNLIYITDNIDKFFEDLTAIIEG
ncbi:SMI1/KNR4 family protein [Macrococcus armenti]|uniref:SMI1/KNR4 family protein n=1 Tax=Macrococcus armenti TaxID=2875764 RepID=UPI001CCF6159|nr:SMI1/KNR4 family protein [Macrococcus armenti]UBH07736.1 SMI1/KNR4 family protein [Macrococcus armenti]UBH09971.1 SMI1/KNR4 family protein [Macrococcus armenti]